MKNDSCNFDVSSKWNVMWEYVEMELNPRYVNIHHFGKNVKMNRRSILSASFSNVDSFRFYRIRENFSKWMEENYFLLVSVIKIHHKYMMCCVCVWQFSRLKRKKEQSQKSRIKKSIYHVSFLVAFCFHSSFRFLEYFCTPIELPSDNHKRNIGLIFVSFCLLLLVRLLCSLRYIFAFILLSA